MNKPRRVKRVQVRSFSAHHMLTDAADRANESAKANQRGSFYGDLSAMLYYALAIEALCNSIGARIIENWEEDFESARPFAKLRLLADRLGIHFDRDKEPRATAQLLIRFRNVLVHAKPESLTEEELMTHEEHDRRAFDVPTSKLERLISRKTANRAVEQVDRIEEILLAKLPREHAVELKIDSWTTHVEEHHDA